MRILGAEDDGDGRGGEGAGKCVRRDGAVVYGEQQRGDAEHGYDDQNRLLALSYNDGTPAVAYAYDAEDGSNRPGNCAASGAPLGRLSSVTNGVSANYYYYSALGYSRCSRQLTDTKTYDFAYGMSPQGAILSLTYPSGRAVSTSLDDAGRATSVTSGGKTYASEIQYTSHGAVKGLKLGNGLVENWTYNSRLQPAQLVAGTLLTAGC